MSAQVARGRGAFRTNEAFKLCMAGEAGSNYQLLASTDLNSTNWLPLGLMDPTNGIYGGNAEGRRKNEEGGNRFRELGSRRRQSAHFSATNEISAD